MFFLLGRTHWEGYNALPDLLGGIEAGKDREKRSER